MTLTLNMGNLERYVEQALHAALARPARGGSQG